VTSEVAATAEEAAVVAAHVDSPSPSDEEEEAAHDGPGRAAQVQGHTKPAEEAPYQPKAHDVHKDLHTDVHTDVHTDARTDVAADGVEGRSSHSSTFRLNVSAFLWDRGCIWGIFRGGLGGVRGYQGVYMMNFVSETAQVEMESERE